jgi:hypothetical protein
MTKKKKSKAIPKPVIVGAIILGLSLLVVVPVLVRRKKQNDPINTGTVDTPALDPPVDPGPNAISYLNDPNYSNLPRGMKNNNPGNIVLSSSAWKGKIPNRENTDGKFEQFVSYQYGVRAMIVLVQNYMNRYGLNTIGKIIQRWCGTNCNYNSYVNSVSQSTGYAANQILPNSMDVVVNVVRGLAQFEQGKPGNQLIPDALINQAIELI